MSEAAAIAPLSTAERNELISEMFDLKRDIEAIESGSLKEFKARRVQIENILKATLEVGEKVAFSGMGSVSMKEEIQPNVVDWDALYAHIVEHDAFYLLNRKVNGAPFREAIVMGESIPGLAPVVVRKLSVRKAA